MINATFGGTDLKVIRNLDSAGPAVIAEMKRRMGIEGVKLQSHIVLTKLQGQVLHHRSGKLAASIRALPVTEEGGSLVERVEGAGGPAWYGRIHNEGGVFTFLRQNKKRSFGTYVTAVFPRRNFMESSLYERAASIVAALQQGMRGEP